MENTGQQDTFAQSDTQNSFEEQKSTILVIDDELGPRESLKILFKDDYRVITANTGEEGIASLKKHTPDIVILDLKMPGKSGIETLEEIRDIDGNVPVVILTGYGDMDAAKKAMHLNAMEFISKPFDIEEIKKNSKRGL